MLELALSPNSLSSDAQQVGNLCQSQYDWARIAAETELVYREAIVSRGSTHHTLTTAEG